MVAQELGIPTLEPETAKISAAMTIGVSYIVGSIVPLVAYFFFPIPIALPLSLVLTFVALVVVGIIKGKLASMNLVRKHRGNRDRRRGFSGWRLRPRHTAPAYLRLLTQRPHPPPPGAARRSSPLARATSAPPPLVATTRFFGSRTDRAVRASGSARRRGRGRLPSAPRAAIVLLRAPLCPSTPQ
jgi:hypothetical protein